MTSCRSVLLACLPVMLVACATQRPPASVDAGISPQWHAPAPVDAAALPHRGTVADVARWWQQQGDPVVGELIQAAQSVSPTVAAAKSRIEQARAAKVAAGAALAPALNGAVSASRSSAQPPLPINTVVQAALQPSWEIDLFGGARNNRDAAQARLDGAQAGWHEARVAVAAEVATQYYSLRACERQLAIVSADAASRTETARLTELSARAGFQAPATAALARATAAEGRSRAAEQRTQCTIDVKALVALTGLPEPQLRGKLAGAGTDVPLAISIPVPSLPAQILAQRPDIFSAEREVAAASAEVGSRQAQRYPRLTLSGSVGLASFRAGGVTTDLGTWSVGPLALSVPIFDAGQRAANVVAAQARYEEAASNYRARVRQAVREVEETLVRLDGIAQRLPDASTAVEGYRISLAALEDRYANGFASLIELEEVRRTRLAAETTLVALERERAAAWIALYRAVGGGWSSDRLATPLSSTTQ